MIVCLLVFGKEYIVEKTHMTQDPFFYTGTLGSSCCLPELAIVIQCFGTFLSIILTERSLSDEINYR